ncbi:uncharacterized protein LOC141892448 isoform X6 [Acropora palmata]|uniref:uncharacterized protein LOC141892448 isoform X6 n=1 Tax=Acropora palmata TaxID=6131 RepID=UPI003DA03D7D
MLTKNLRRREIKGGTKGGRRSHEDVNAGLNREERGKGECIRNQTVIFSLAMVWKRSVS